MSALGSWQLARARDQGGDAVRRALTRPPVELTTIMRAQRLYPAEAVDRPVTVSGSWDGAAQLVVPERYRDGVAGVWVLTPLRLDDGSRLPVVRGWAPDEATARASAAALPPGRVGIAGVMRLGEQSPPPAPGQAPPRTDGRVAWIDPVDLIERWPGPLFTGYLVQTGPDAAAGGLAPVSPDGGTARLDWQNLSYALQWWLFAGFGFFLWARLVRDDHRGVRPGGGAGAPPAPGAGRPRATMPG